MRIKGRSFGHFAVLVPALVAACSGTEPPTGDDPRCLDETAPNPPPNGQGARFLGNINVVDVHQWALDDADMLVETNIGRITGTFADFQGVGTSTPASQIQLGPRCVGFVSLSMAVSPSPVGIDSLVVDGTNRGAVPVPANAPGVHLAVGMPLLAGASMLTAKVTSTAGGFPAFERMFEPAMPIEMTSPASDGTGEVPRASLRVQWNEGNGDAVVIVISPNLPPGMVQSGGQIVCEVVDDGCFDIPAGASTFLLSANVESYKMVLSRARASGEAVDADTFVRVGSASEWRVDLQNGAFQ